MKMAAGLGGRGGTRVRELEHATAVKRRKVEEDEESRISSSPCVQLRNSETVLRSSVEPPKISFVSHRWVAGDPSESRCSDRDHRGASVSCCSSSSSNGSSEKLNERIEFVDLGENIAQIETPTYDSCDESTTQCSEQREESEGMDSSTAVNQESQRRSTPEKPKTMVTEAELEEFFSVTDREVFKLFELTRKYNFDFAKEEPLDGRYEWIKLKP